MNNTLDKNFDDSDLGESTLTDKIVKGGRAGLVLLLAFSAPKMADMSVQMMKQSKNPIVSSIGIGIDGGSYVWGNGHMFPTNYFTNEINKNQNIGKQ